jgi:hypothetical protein
MILGKLDFRRFSQANEDASDSAMNSALSRFWSETPRLPILRMPAPVPHHCAFRIPQSASLIALAGQAPTVQCTSMPLTLLPRKGSAVAGRP